MKRWFTRKKLEEELGFIPSSEKPFLHLPLGSYTPYHVSLPTARTIHLNHNPLSSFVHYASELAEEARKKIQRIINLPLC